MLNYFEERAKLIEKYNKIKSILMKTEDDNNELKALDKKYDRIMCKEIMSSYLYYGESFRKFISMKYKCSERFTISDLKNIWKETIKCMK